MKRVAIYRNQLFKLSETFIVNQAISIKKFDVDFIGREIIGEPPSPHYEVYTSVKNSGIFSAFSKTFQSLTMHQGALVRETRERKYDIVHAHFAIDALYALNYTKKIDVPLFTTLHGFDVTTSKRSLILSKSPSWINYALFQRRLKREGSLFLCVSDFIRNKAIEAGFKDLNTFTLRIGVDIDTFKQNGEIKDERTIIHVGRLVEKKGTDILINAIRKIKDRLDGYQVHIIGNGPLRGYLTSLIKYCELENHVKMLGPLPHAEVMARIKKASFAVVPSVKAENGDCEGLPTVIMEAAAFSLPVIGTYHAGIPEAIIDGKTGYLVKEKDADELAQRILALIQSDKLRNEFGSAARDLMVKEFNLTEQTKKLERMYEAFL